MPALRSHFDKIAILAMSAIFLGVIVVFLILVGMGRVNLGLDPSLSFLLYVIAGLLVAFATFGILTSSGELSGSPFGVNVRLGGSIVAAVIVGAGGSLYEIYVRPSSFSTRILFYESSPANPVNLTGQFSLLVGSGIRSEAIQSDGTVLFQNLNKRQALPFILASPAYEVDPRETSTITLAPDSLVSIRVHRKTPFEGYATSNLTINFDSASVIPTVSGEYSVVIRTSAWSTSERPVPLRGTAVLQLTKSGLHFRDFTGDVTSSTSDTILLVKRGQPETLVVDILMPSDYKDMLNLGLDAGITFKYADPNKAEGGDFDMGPVAFDAKNFPLAK